MKTVKTAISLPDEIFDRVSRRAADLGISRSEFFARAAQRYLDEFDAESLSSQIDQALDVLGAPDDTQEAAVEVGRRVLTAADDDW
jgi:metal-responsive CopG/Arc/MetJ family transcriptional regulator